MFTQSNGLKPAFPENAASKEYATSLDAADPLGAFRRKFIVPSKANLASKKLAKPSTFRDRTRCDTSPNGPCSRSLKRPMHLLLWQLPWYPA